MKKEKKRKKQHKANKEIKLKTKNPEKYNHELKKGN